MSIARRYCRDCGSEMRLQNHKAAFHPETGELESTWGWWRCPRSTFWGRLLEQHADSHLTVEVLDDRRDP